MHNDPILENNADFERRKREHIHYALDARAQSLVRDLDYIELVHEALPEIDFSEISLSTPVLGQMAQVPFFISSMTAGHVDGEGLNLRLAKAAEIRGWPMGVGSQRKQLFSSDADREWQTLRRQCPKVILFGNLGLSQVIRTSTSDIAKLVDSLEAKALFVHTNPLQEVIQEEGTPFFKGGLQRLGELVQTLKVPVILKETGCGFSLATLERLRNIGIELVDVSGRGGTHWGRIEGLRAKQSVARNLSEVFADWGISTVESLQNAKQVGGFKEVWASGGVRTGLDAAKLMAMGADRVGFAQTLLAAAVEGEETLNARMQQLELELKTAMFCMGISGTSDFKGRTLWREV